MTAERRLVIFDVDGTLVDSQGDIIAAMTQAFAAVDVVMPARRRVLATVGLSLDVIFPRLVPQLDADGHHVMAEAYKAAYMALRAESGVAQSSPLYPGARDVLEGLRDDPDVILGVATGKSKRGLDKLIEGHGLEGVFATQQVADVHPSKPHPAMVLQALAETGVAAEQAVMIGDTSFDMEMSAAAGVRGIGVSWGYHPVADLGQAHHVLGNFAELPSVLKSMWEVSA